MIITGHSLFSSSLRTQNDVGEASSVELSGGVTVDELSIKNDEYFSKDSLKEEWGNNTVILSKFNNSLESGSILMGEVPVERIRIDRIDVNADSPPITVGYIPYDYSDNPLMFVDKTASPLKTYQYTLTPMVGDVEGSVNDAVVKTDLDGAIIIGKDKRYSLEYGFQISNINDVHPNTVIQTVGNKRTPFVVYHGGLNYYHGNIKFILLSNRDNAIDLSQEMTFRENVMSFLTDKKAKILKTNDGYSLLISVVGDPVISNEGRPGLYSVEFEFVEVGDLDNQVDLLEHGFIEVV